MKRVVNGEEVELISSPGVSVRRIDDRLMLRTTEGSNSACAAVIGDAVHISYLGRVFVVGRAGSARAVLATESTGEIRAPMPGQIVDVLVGEGREVSVGAKIVVLEAMKTQQALTAPFDGTVTRLSAQRGKQVSEGDLLAVVEPRPNETHGAAGSNM